MPVHHKFLKSVLPAREFAAIRAGSIFLLVCALWFPSSGEACVGDIDGDNRVTVGELVGCINRVLCPHCLNSAFDTCVESYDGNNDGAITVNELIRGVNNALSGCPPVTPPAGRCRSDSPDCDSSFEWCLEPGGFLGCGVCYTDSDLDAFTRCSADVECKAIAEHWICGELGPFFDDCSPCEGPVLVCGPGCSDDVDCSEGQICEVNRCIGSHCSNDEECPGTSHCVSHDGAGRCQRRFCEADLNCPAGFCVNASCYSEFGRCVATPP